ncbi:GNAT family protein [Meiothermus sp. CFH 77666]|uniref:GNAT family N-acetyltransferase n=1 Tax=Meiothermus sp. CFH 77666 TaxID=2817942 RepID=UPI001AA04C20|nr:GNAT family protein [Meiothermus sp. CFH 77666]MBO1437073.1 GNAT family N-acetyltransferase [Meiothermus sp. CFH 77666]
MLAHRLDEDSELRLLQAHHAEALYALADRNRTHLRAWLAWVDSAHDLSFMLNFIRGRLEALAAGQGYSLSIWHKGGIAGVVGLYDLDQAARKAEIGYWLGQEFEGLGLMTRSVRALLDYAFGEVGLHRVQIKVHVDNLRSRAIPERLGLQLEGLLRNDGTLHGKPCDHALYAITDQEWFVRSSS